MREKNSAQCSCLKKVIKDLSQESIESTDTIINIQRDFLSEVNLVEKQLFLINKPLSEPNLYYIANYDDICGPWLPSDHPSFQRYDDTTMEPILCAWKFITIQDMSDIKINLYSKNMYQYVFEKKLSRHLIFNSKSKELYFGLLWKLFKYTRNNNYSAKRTSSVLGLFYLTHRSFLSDFWHSADETLAFLKRGLNLHSTLKLPESDMIFDFLECDQILDTFWSFYLKNWN